MDLSRLLSKCRQGDELAWEALVRRYQGRVYGLAYHYLLNAEEARDLSQEIFIRIYNRLETCTNDETFVPWMLRLARNACIDRIRRIKARPAAVATPVDEMLHLRSATPDPAEQWARDSKKNLVHQAMRKLSDINREMILLKEIQGLSLEEISDLLDCPLGTVKSRSNRARIELARQIVALRGEAGASGIEA